MLFVTEWNLESIHKSGRMYAPGVELWATFATFNRLKIQVATFPMVDVQRYTTQKPQSINNTA